MPAMNAESFIGDSMASFYRQGLSVDQIEVVFINDGSSDRTEAVVDEHRGSLPRLKILRNRTNVGLAAARNQGLEVAEGEYLTFLDGDDWYAPGHLKHMVETLRRTGAEFAKSDFTEVRNFKRDRIYLPCFPRDTCVAPTDHILPAQSSSMIDFPHVWAGVYTRALLDRGLLEFDPELLTAEDRPWAWRLHMHAASMAVTSGPGVCYRRNVEGSLTQILDKRQLLFTTSFDKVIDVIEHLPDDHDYWVKLARTWIAILSHQIARSAKATRDYRRELRSRSILVTARISSAALHEALIKFGDQRTRRVRPIIAAAKGPRLLPGKSDSA